MEGEKNRWWMDVGAVTGVLALIFSLYSIHIANQQHADSEGTALINETYATYHEISAKRMETIEISHLVCSPERYPTAVERVKRATAGFSPDQRAEALLREDAMAQYLFAQFEQTVYLHRNAMELGDTERIRFSQDTLDYFTDTLLRNPRLVHFWSASGENMRVYYVPICQKYWDEKVRPHVTKVDATGPFGS